MDVCPHCGKNLTRPGRVRRTWSAYNTWRRRQRTELASNALVPWEPPKPASQRGHFEAIREMPARAQTVESDFLAPFLQAIGLGLFVFLTAGYVVWYNGLTWHVACIVPIAAAGLYYLAALGANRKLLWIVESIIQSDLDGDGVTGPPPVVRVETQHSDQHGHHWQFADLAIDQARLIGFAKDVEAGHSFSERTAKRSGVTQDELKKLRNEFISRGWAEWNHPKRPQQGITLSRNGRAIIRAIAASPSPDGAE